MNKRPIMTEPQKAIHRIRRILTGLEFELMEEKPNDTTIANSVELLNAQLHIIMKG